MFKTLFTFIILTTTVCICSAQVKIGNNPSAINNASLLELESNNKGLLLPRMNEADMRAILLPPKGLVVFNTTDSSIYFRRDTGWASLSTAKTTASPATNCAFYAALISSQTIANYTFTSLLPYLEYYDKGSNFNPATGNFTARDAGVYHFEISVVVPPQGSNTAFGVRTFINGDLSSQKFLVAPSFDALFNASLVFTFDVELNAGNIYSFQFLQRTGTTMSVSGPSIEPTYFSGFKVF